MQAIAVVGKMKAELLERSATLGGLEVGGEVVKGSERLGEVRQTILP